MPKITITMEWEEAENSEKLVLKGGGFTLEDLTLEQQHQLAKREPLMHNFVKGIAHRLTLAK